MNNIQRVFSKNAAYQKFEVLKTNRNKRYKYGEFIVEGVRNINQAISNEWTINSFLYSSKKELSKWAKDLLKTVKTKVNYELANELMINLSGKSDVSELMAVIQMKDDEQFCTLSDNPIIALFDRPSNKGNLGTLFRSCDAFGVDELIITGHGVDTYDPDVVSSSMGSFFNVPFLRYSDNSKIDGFINNLKSSYSTLKIIGTTAHAQTSLQDVDMTSPVMFLIGNETDGLNRHFSEICDIMAAIPMSSRSSASSFNVSCAATVMFYEANKQRGFW